MRRGLARRRRRHRGAGGARALGRWGDRATRSPGLHSREPRPHRELRTPVAQGPFTGRYAAAKGRAPLAEVTLTQDGSLLAGIGIVTGDPVGVAGRTTGATSAAGLVTFRDGTQVRWSADLAADGTLTLTGFGDPIALHRRPR
ncbi:MAG: hypothetical protein R2991_09085 [Thermoanaerobaculia bacterium]